MSYETKPNKGALFKNDRKQKEEDAAYTGTMNIEGNEFYINAWVKEGAKGKYFSLSFKPKLPKQTTSDAPF